MRQAQFRQPANRDWGLPPFTGADVWNDLRHAASQVTHHLLTHRLEARRLRRYLARHPGPVLLSIGSGRAVQPGWVGVDLKTGDRVFRCDLRKQLPLPDASVDAILAEHVLEHFCLDDLPALLAETRRVLKPGAPLRIVSPDATIVAALVQGEDSARLTYQFGQHQVLLTGPLAARLLAVAGFTGIRCMSMTETVYFDEAPGTHLTRFPDSAHEAFTVEAARPGPAAMMPPARGCDRADA